MTAEPHATPVRLLFVCTANRVRSPFAEALARNIVDSGRLPVQVASAGTEATSAPAVVNMVEVAAKFGVDLSGHRSRRVDVDLTSTADLIVTMTGEQVIEVVGVDPDATRRTITLVEFAAATTQVGVPQWDGVSVRTWAAGVTDRPIAVVLGGALDVADPIGGPKRAYRRTAREITDLLSEAFGMSSTALR